MNFKRILVLVIAVALIASALVGCGSATTTKTEEATKQATTTQASTDTAKEDNKPITLKMFYGFAGGDIPDKENDTVKWLAEKTGVTIDIDYLVGDLKTKLGVMIASGDYPDLIWGHEEHQKFIDAGACVPLDEYIEKFGENTKKTMGQYLKRLKKDDGKIYFLTNQREDIDISRAISGFYIQKAVLKEAGWPKISTLDEYFDLIKNYTQKHPKVDGKDTIGFEILTDNWRFFCLQNPPSYLVGAPNDGKVIVDPNTFEAKTYATADLSKKYYQKLNDMFKLGLVDKEAFTMNYDSYIAKLTSGRVLGFYDQWWQMNPAQDALKQQKMYDQLYVALPLTFDKGTRDQYQYPGTFGTRDGVSISKTCKEPERAFKFLDFMLSEEAQKVIRWGFKDKDYTVDSKGKMTRTPEQRVNAQNIEYRKKTGLGFYVYPWPRTCINDKYSDGNYYDPTGDPDEVMSGYQDFDKDVLNAYGVKVYADMFAKPDITKWGVAWDIVLPDDSPAKIFDTKSNDVQKQYLPQLVMAKEGQFDNVWNKYVEEFNKLDVKAYEQFLTEKVKERVQKWN